MANSTGEGKGLSAERWQCPRCYHVNRMEFEKCENCSAPHRDFGGEPLLKIFQSALLAIPKGNRLNLQVNRYDTDDEYVLQLYGAGITYDIRAPKTTSKWLFLSAAAPDSALRLKLEKGQVQLAVRALWHYKAACSQAGTAFADEIDAAISTLLTEDSSQVEKKEG